MVVFHSYVNLYQGVKSSTKCATSARVQRNDWPIGASRALLDGTKFFMDTEDRASASQLQDGAPQICERWFIIPWILVRYNPNSSTLVK